MRFSWHHPAPSCPALSCPVFVLFCPVKYLPNRQTTSSLRPVPRLRWHRSLWLLWQDECIRRIRWDSNIKKLSRFTVTSWIVTFQEASEGLNQCAKSVCIRMSRTASRCHNALWEKGDCLSNDGFHAPF